MLNMAGSVIVLRKFCGFSQNKFKHYMAEILSSRHLEVNDLPVFILIYFEKGCRL